MSLRFIIDTSLQCRAIDHGIHGPNLGPTSSESYNCQKNFTAQELSDSRSLTLRPAVDKQFTLWCVLAPYSRTLSEV
jgi:hypothetical protein